MTNAEIAQVLEKAADILETEITYSPIVWADTRRCTVCQIGALGLAVEKILFPESYTIDYRDALSTLRVLRHEDILDEISRAAWDRRWIEQGNVSFQKRNFPNGAPDVIRDLREKAAALTGKVDLPEQCSTVTTAQPVEVGQS